MHKIIFTRVIALGAFAAFCLCAAQQAAFAAELNTANFVAACAADENVTDDPGFEDGKVTPKAYCECVAAEILKNKLSQGDVDMLTKMHKDDISDNDAENYPTLEDLMNANEGYEDSCRTKSRHADRRGHRGWGRRRGRRGSAGRRSSGRGSSPAAIGPDARP